MTPKTPGIPLDELRCPTCGEEYPYEVRVVLEATLDVQRHDYRLREALARHPDIQLEVRCEEGHRWSIKAVYDTIDQPDHIQLDQYLPGEHPLATDEDDYS